MLFRPPTGNANDILLTFGFFTPTPAPIPGPAPSNAPALAPAPDPVAFFFPLDFLFSFAPTFSAAARQQGQ